jgi:xanthine dehydrogenase accessory factor
MRDILSDVTRWLEEGESIALATVVQTWGSSPRTAGSRMALTATGKITGSVSGGCVENAVVEAGIESLKTGRPQLLHFGVADETAWEVGLACGGSIDIFVQPLDSGLFQTLKSALVEDTPVVHAIVIRSAGEMPGREYLVSDHRFIAGPTGNEWDAAVLNMGIQALSQGGSRREQLNESTEVFLDVLLPPPTLVLVGGVHIAVALASLARTLGYRTVLVDPRKAWGSEDRFPHVDQLIQEWIPDAFAQIHVTRSTAVAMLTHDPKLDDPALKIALDSPAFYVGALGSKSTNAKRRERLLAGGVTESQLSRLHAPIGIDIGASTPEEIALAVMSEVVKSHREQNPVKGRKETEQVQSPVSTL